MTELNIYASYQDALSQRWDVNIVVLGGVSAGKTTLVNTLLVNTYSDMKIKRTTMVPQIYREMDLADVPVDPQVILSRNKEINDRLLKKSSDNVAVTYEDISEVEYFVPSIPDFVRLPDKVFLSIYDTPGLNDAHTKDIYFRYIEENFHKFDIILLVLDVNSGMNTSDEMDILKLIIAGIKENQKIGISNYLVVIINKCDDMYLDDDGQLVMDEEVQEMFDQASATIHREITNSGVKFPYNITPLSCQDAYVYRTCVSKTSGTKSSLSSKYQNKIGIDEHGKKGWNSMTSAQRASFIKEFLENHDDSTKLMDANGFRKLQLHLQDNLRHKHQYMYLRNRSKHFWSRLFAQEPLYQDHNFSAIKKQYVSCSSLKRKYNKTNYKCNENIISNFETMLSGYYRAVRSTISDSSDIAYVEAIYKHFTELSVLVNISASEELIHEFAECMSGILEMINNEYISKFMTLDASNPMDVTQAKHYLDILKANNCQRLIEAIRAYLVYLIPIVLTELTPVTEQKYFTLLRHYVMEYELNNNQVIAMIAKILPHLYELYYKLDPQRILVIKQFIDTSIVKYNAPLFRDLAIYLQVLLHDYLARIDRFHCSAEWSTKFRTILADVDARCSLSIEKYLEMKLIVVANEKLSNS